MSKDKKKDKKKAKFKDVSDIIGSCSCLTKTPEVGQHSPTCNYRRLIEEANKNDANADISYDLILAIRNVQAALYANSILGENIVLESFLNGIIEDLEKAYEMSNTDVYESL